MVVLLLACCSVTFFTRVLSYSHLAKESHISYIFIYRRKKFVLELTTKVLL